MDIDQNMRQYALKITKYDPILFTIYYFDKKKKKMVTI